ncbi:hypothetical protein DM02DRAFT_139479 [Periconia macrospinosa]|uniref:Uncharacterized protein n=1 Tax=Periconia macrospinosa TaxID=97972 RepID=A0A2V1DCF2_9PLEO|nr:hypothetical protein DM02DRAFT_139479 [Periconia macrospinosa]
MNTLSTLHPSTALDRRASSAVDVYGESLSKLMPPTLAGKTACLGSLHSTQTSVDSLPDPALHVAECINPSNDIFNYNDGPLQDGERLWYCGSCGDGPIGVWNPVCVTCGHKRDDCCTVTEK